MLGKSLGYHFRKAFATQRDPWTPEERDEIAAGMLTAVSALNDDLHYHHLDLKPDNFLLSSATPPTKVVLTDFGLCQPQSTELKLDFVYSLWWRPPELMLFSPQGYLLEQAPSGRYNVTSEAWALGVTLYELYYLTNPFSYRELDEIIKDPDEYSWWRGYAGIHAGDPEDILTEIKEHIQVC